MPFCLTGCSKSDSPTAQDGGPNKTDGGTCADGTSPPCPQPKVIRITAVLPGTKSLRDRTKHLADNSLRSSTSKENSLDANAPVVLVRGCTPVDLTAETDPPNTKVTWSVAPNENTETPPTYTEIGLNKIRLATSQTGAFSVIATLNASKIVWNVVFVWVKVDVKSSVIKLRKDLFADGSSPGWTVFRSAPPPYTKGHFPWEAQVDVKLIGASAGRLNTIHLHVLQNGVTDTVTGNYAAPAITAVHEEPKLSDGSTALPILDANDTPPPPYLTDARVFEEKPATGAARTVWTGDPPADQLPDQHRDAPHPALATTSGGYGFQTAIVSISDDAPNSIVAHAMTKWSIDFSGKTTTLPGPPPRLVWKPKGAAVTKERRYAPISAATGGSDACDAGFEIWAPHWNDPSVNPPNSLKWF